MFETLEDYKAAYDAAPDKEAFIAQHGDGSGLHTAAELATSELEELPTVEPDGTPMIPVTADSEVPEFLKNENEPEDVDDEGNTQTRPVDEEYKQYLRDLKEKERQEEQARYEGKMKRAKAEADARQYITDKEGNVVHDVNGNPVKRDLSTFDKINNSIRQMGGRFEKLVPNLTITAGEIMKNLVPEELWDDYNKHGENSALARMTTGTMIPNLFAIEAVPTEEDVDKAIKESQLVSAETEGETGSISQGIKEGDIGEVAAGLTNAATSFIPSIAMGIMTMGTSTGAELFGDMYVGYNEAKAKGEGKTLEQLRAEGEDGFVVPAVLGGLATMAEMVGFKGVGNAILNNVGKSAAKRGAAVLMAGNKEGLTELFQTGLEGANVAMAESKDSLTDGGKAFVDNVLSEQGLESYLQGFAGGAGMSAGGSITKNDVNDLRKAASAMRAPEDVQGIYNALAKQGQLRKMAAQTQDPDLKENYNKQIKDLDQYLKGQVIHANGFVQRMDDTTAGQAAKLADERAAAKSTWENIQQKFNNGEITVEEKNAAAQGYGATIKDINRRTEELKAKLEDMPNVRNKDGSANDKGLWNTKVKQKIDNTIDKKGAEGAWDIVQDKDFNKFLSAKVRNAWNKVPTDLQEATTFEDVMNEVMYGGAGQQSQSIVGTLNAYKNDGRSKASSYLLGNLDKKVTGVIQKLTGQETAQGTKGGRVSGTNIKVEGINEDTGRGPQIEDTSTIVEETRRRTTEEVAQNLGIGAQTAANIKDKMQTLVADGVMSPSDKKFESTYVQRFRDHIAPAVQKEMGRGQKYIDYVTNNAEQLLNIYPARTLSKKRDDPAYSWIDKPPTVQEFIDYHLPTEKVKDDNLMDAFMEAEKVADKNGDFPIAVENATDILNMASDLDDGPLVDAYSSAQYEFEEQGGDVDSADFYKFWDNKLQEEWEWMNENSQDPVGDLHNILEQIQDEDPQKLREHLEGWGVPLKGKKDSVLESKRKRRLAEAISEGIGFRAMEDQVVEQAQESTRDKINKGFDAAIDLLKKLQGERGTLQSNPLAIAPAVLESAVRATKAAFNAGADLATAIQKGYEKIADKVDLADYRKYIAGEINKIKSVANWAQQQEQKIEQQKQEAAVKVQEAVDPESSFTTFQETQQTSDKDVSKIAADYDTILKRFGIEGGAATAKTDRAGLQDWAANTLTKYLPREFFMSKNVAGAKGPDRYFIWDNTVQMNEAIEGKTFGPDGGIDWKLVGKVEIKKDIATDPKKLAAVVKKNDARQKANMDALEFLAKQIEKMVQDNPDNARYAAGLLMNFQNSQAGIVRAAAPMRGTSLYFPTVGSKKVHGKIFVEEHTMPQNVVAKYILHSALDPNVKMDEAFKNVRKNFFQIILNTDHDLRMVGKEQYQTKTGLTKERTKYNYTTAMPEGWKMSDSAWARYFNENVAGEGGIDPNSIFLFDENMTVAQKYGADVKGNINPEIVKAQQKVVAEKVGDNVELFLDKAIGALEGIVKNDGVLQANIAAVPVHVLVGGLRAAKLAYRGARNLAQAVEAGYNAVKKYMTRQEWSDFAAKAITEVKDTPTGATIGLQFATENAVKLQQQADLNEKFNEIIEQKTKGRIPKTDVFSRADIGKGKSLGGIRSFFNHPSAEDFTGLLYTILPSGKAGEQAMQYFKENLITPYQRGVTQMNAYKANLHAAFGEATKLASNAKLNKTVPGTSHSWNNAARVALAKMNGQDTGMNSETEAKLLEAIQADPKMSAFVDKINDIFDGNFEFDPKDINRPLGGEIAGMADKVKRSEFLSDYLNNAEQIFSEENMNKIEATAGRAVRDNLEKTLARMKSGKNRTISSDSSTNKLLDWVNNATAMIMFTNMRSAALQTLSMFNYINTGGNNLFQAGKNLANIKQYRKDIKELWNSDYLVGRRGKLGFDIAADEIADAAGSLEGYNNLMSKIRQLGFKPTQIMDSFAISRGGALYYRTRLNKYEKEGHPNPKQAAMDDFVAITEESQQSADPSKISQIQAGPLGRIIFAFGNTPFQYARVMKRAISDLAAGRGNPANNVARVAYYSAIQAMMFNYLQQALWMGDDEEKEERKTWAIQGAIGSFFKSLGLGGAAASTALSLALETQKARPDFVNAATSISPPISAKLRQLGRAGKAVKKGDVMEASVKGAEAVFNVPTDRVMTKFNNMQDVLSGDLDGWETLLKTLGWSDYSLGIGDDVRDRTPRRKSQRRRQQRKRQQRERRSPNRRLDSPFNRSDGPMMDTGEVSLTLDQDRENLMRSQNNMLGQKINNLSKGLSNLAQNLGEDNSESPMMKLGRGEMGQAFKDGTIEVDPNLDPVEKEITIKHEQKHADDMKKGILNYTDDHVTYKGKKYKRKDGKIEDGKGGWKKEGDPSFPWEKAAYNAEPSKKSVLNKLYGKKR